MNAVSTVNEDRQVALNIVAREYAYGRKKIKGVIQYQSRAGNWKLIHNALSIPFIVLDDICNSGSDGVICDIYSVRDMERIAALPIPYVNTSSFELASKVPTVRSDNRAVGRMAAEHLMECSLDNYAFVGPINKLHALERYEGFSRTLEKAGHECVLINCEPCTLEEGQNADELVSADKIIDSLSCLSMPVGIMASSDRVGFAVLEACRKAGLQSPEDVAVVGVDNDEIYCNLAYTSMTSIVTDACRVGYCAAAMLEKLMNGEPLKETQMLIPPLKVVRRNSSDMIRSEYPEVSRVLRFIRDHAHEYLDVSNVLEVVPVSRRTLEKRFKAEVGHGIYEEIRIAHIERAKELLVSTDLPIWKVASESGFNSIERFDISFQKMMSMCATEYRTMNK